MLLNRYLEDQENKTNEAAAVSKRLAEQKQELVEEIQELTKEIQETDTEFRKVEDALDNYKRKCWNRMVWVKDSGLG